MPCDQILTMKAAYRAEHKAALVRAGARVGLEVMYEGPRGRVLFEAAEGGRIDVTPGQVQLSSGATEAEAAGLLRAYAEEVFDQWVSGYPDTYQEQGREADGARVFNVGKGGY